MRSIPPPPNSPLTTHLSATRHRATDRDHDELLPLVGRVLPYDGAGGVRQDLVAHVLNAGRGRLQLAEQHGRVVGEAVGHARLQTAARCRSTSPSWDVLL